ncbi:MAG: translocation/assembly module TamB domain-containing protein, partial [Geminicoccaceae bacterium]
DPSLPQDEILSRLLFNRQISEIGPVQAAQLAMAANRLRGGGPGVLGKIRSVTGLDTLDVTGGGSSQDPAKVRAGKYLRDDVYVELEQGAADKTGKASVELEILPNVAIKAEAGANAKGGVGLQWKFDY